MQILSADPTHGQRVTGLRGCRTVLLVSSFYRGRNASATATRRELGWPTLVSRRALAESQMVHWCVHAVLHSIWLLSLSKVRVSIYTIQGQQQLVACKSFAFQGCRQWNPLPPSLRSIKNPTSFVTVVPSDLLKYT